jgi:hypothetical protein
MATYEVTGTYEVWHRVEVEADSLEDALALGEIAIMSKGQSEEIGGEWQDSFTAEEMDGE